MGNGTSKKREEEKRLKAQHQKWEKAHQQKRLWEAWLYGDVEDVRAALKKKNVDVNWAYEGGRTLLHLASEEGDVPVVELLLQANATVDATDEEQVTPLLLASEKGLVQVVELLVKWKADANVTAKFKKIPLIVASARGHAPVVKLLLEANANVNVVDTDGKTPLHLASERDDTHVVELLLQANANVDATDEYGRTPLHLASETGRVQIVELLLQANASVDATDRYGRTPLHLASETGRVQTVERLLQANANVNATTKYGRAPLAIASYKDRVQVVELLLQRNANVDLVDQDGRTPLHLASEKGRVQVVELLLRKNASVNLVDEHAADANATDHNGSTPLHLAAVSGHGQIVKLLLEHSSDVKAADKNGNTPLHLACRAWEDQVAAALLEMKAELHTVNKDGDEPLHMCIASNSKVSESTLRTLQVLVTYGSVWDSKCDEMVASGKACGEASALRICMSTWCKERAGGAKYTQVPIEVIDHDPASTQSYIEEIKASTRIEFRRKICVVGSSMAGKTSLIKSLMTKVPSLEHPKDRTIGIETSELRFESTDEGESHFHVVTFWDFAGQNAYHVAHSLFFSRRTLFLVCVDLEAYVTALMQADLMGNNNADRNQLMNEFIESEVLTWVRMIFVHQPDAEFAFIATKDDQFVEFPAFTKIAKKILNDKLGRVHGIAVEMKREHGMSLRPAQGDRTAETLTIHAYERRLFARDHSLNGANTQAMAVYVSCTSAESVGAAWTNIKTVIAKSSRSFEMPDKFSAVLKAVTDLRAAAAESGPSQRISKVFMLIDKLIDHLVSVSDEVDRDRCRSILQILHSLGDVLWYEDLGVDLFSETVILDPMLLIDFVRQVITHENAVEVLSHNELMGKPFWQELRDEKQLLAMKQLMQKFQLVHSSARKTESISDSSNGEMEWKSNLIVPAFWKSKTPGSLLFCGEDANLGPTSDIGEKVRVCWEYCFTFEFPDAFFDHLMVATYSPYYQFRKAGPDWTMYEKENVYNCRMIVTRDRATAQRVLCLEAVLAETAGEGDRDELWEVFQLLAKGLFVVLRRYPGLLMTSRARHNTRGEFERPCLDDLLTYQPSRGSHKWMPPPDVLTWYKDIVKARAVQSRRGSSA